MKMHKQNQDGTKNTAQFIVSNLSFYIIVTERESVGPEVVKIHIIESKRMDISKLENSKNHFNKIGFIND